MPSHVPRSEPTKRLDILDRREVALKRAVLERLPVEKLQSAVEAVREAQLNLLKAKIVSIRHRKGFDRETQPWAKAHREIQLWQEATQDEILAKYASSVHYETNDLA